MKKKIVIIIILLLILISLVVLGFIWFHRNNSVNFKKDTFKFEYGEVVNIEGKQVLDTKDTEILKSFKAEYANLKLEEGKKYPKVGTYDLQIKYSINGSNKKENIKIIVKDSKGPEFTKFPDKIEVKKGSDPNEIATYFEAKDLSTVKITVNIEKLTINEVGEYEVEVTAMDQYKNKVVKKANITVVDDQEVVPEDVNNENGTSGNESKPTAYTVSEPRYVKGVMIINKKNPVPYNYMPYENAEAGDKARSLIKEMQNLGYNINSSYSGFRSFDTQAGLYRNYVNNYGSQEADTFSARPGYSEHQTGLAFDLLHKDGTLVENSAEVNWIATNAHKYGFIVRYQVGKEHITGYQAEPWHIRYIGSLATDVYNSGLTLEEYLGVQGGSY
ncbi:MAG: M15 family metallopeptidase [Longicatena sp.]